MLRKRALVESVNDQLKNICQIEHSRHRSVFNFLANLIAGLIAYSYHPLKPSLDLDFKGLSALPMAIFARENWRARSQSRYAPREAPPCTESAPLGDAIALLNFRDRIVEPRAQCHRTHVNSHQA